MVDNTAKNNKAFVHVRRGIVVEVSEKFLKMTGYSAYELIGKSYLDISQMLRFNPYKEIKCLKDNLEIYLFTKLLEPKEVVVSVEMNKDENDIICFFDEKENSHIEGKFTYLEQLFLENKCGIAIYSAPELIMLKANQKYIDYLNEPFNKREICIGKTFDQIVKGYKGSVAEEIWTNILISGKAFYANEVMFERYDRGITYWDSSIVPIYEDGKIKYLIDNAIEVTERVVNRRLVEEQTAKIERQNKEIEAIIDVVDEYISVFNKDGSCISLSKVIKELFKFSEVANIYELKDNIETYDMYGNEISFDDSVFCSISKGKEISNFKGRLKREGIEKYVIMNGKPIFDRSGELEKYVLMINDITEIMQSKIIEEQRNQLEAIIENISVGIYIADKEGKIIVMNAEARKLLYDPDTVQFAGEFTKTTKNFDMMGNEIDVENLPLNRALKGECVKDQIIVMKRPDKEMIIRINSTPIYDSNGKLIFAIACSHDITDLINKEKIIIEKYKQLELLKDEAENAARIKSLFLANMSHEIRTPMNGILGTIQLLESANISSEQSKYIKILKESSNTLLKIINDILDISKIESGTYQLNNEEFSLVEVVNSIYNNLVLSGNSKGLEISYYLDPTIDNKVIGDEQRLKQILNNLISNAVKFTEEGYISLRITKVFSDNDCVEVKFTVKDTGIGIEDSFKEKVFNIFNQGDLSISKKYEGTGLGLAISKQLATLMNGKINFESIVGKGSVFSFTCKFGKSSNRSDDAKTNNIEENNIKEQNLKINVSPKNKVILCVEDNLINQEVMESIVNRHGYKYIAAYNGNDALNILKDNKVDLILMDVQMPELNGFETTKIIRQGESDGKHIPIIAMTAYAMLGDKDKCIRAGMDNYISKPFNIEDLYNMFEFYLGE